MKKTTSVKTEPEIFLSQLEKYRAVIDKRIDVYAKDFETDTSEQFGEIPLIVTHTFTDYLGRGGKRIRGALTMVGYELFGGEDKEMILEAALAIEILQAYILMMDDIQDRSDIRRAGLTAHIMLRDYHEKNHLRGDALHFGESMAMNAFLIGCHSALDIISGLNAKPERVLMALRNIHRCYVTTAYGQTMDIYNEVSDTVNEADVTNVLTWKTAYYTFVNPMQLGAILAGASQKDLDNIYNFAIPAGRAFQITDDILGIFGSEFESGKSPLDDIKEGKRTILTVKALELAPQADSYYLLQCLGKHDLTTSEFKQCQKIISTCGALEYARNLATASVDEARQALANAPTNWNKKSVDFLQDLVGFLLDRKA